MMRLNQENNEFLKYDLLNDNYDTELVGKKVKKK